MDSIGQQNIVRTPAGVLARWVRTDRRAYSVAWTLIACLMMVVGAQLRFVVPGTGVPMTLQPIAMLFVGMTMPPACAMSGMFSYLALGGIGLPVFAGDGGLTGETAGYLVGFALSATVISLLVAGDRRGYLRLLLSGVLGMCILLTCGVLWRMFFFNGAISFALATGAWPFVTKAVLEAAFAATFVHRLQARVGGNRSRSIDGV